MVPLREVALPKVSGTTYTYTFPAISQGEAASVTVSIPGAPPTASWTIYAGSLPVASLAGANAITGLYLSGGEQCSIVGTSPTSPGSAVEVGQLGSLAEVPVTVPTVSPGATTVGNELNVTGTVDVSTAAGSTVDVTGSTVSITAGQVVEVTNQAGGSLTVAGTVDATVQNATIDVSGSTVTIGPGLVSYVALADPAAGSDWAYVFSSTLRLTAVRAILTTSSTQGQRLPYLWQVVGGDTLPTEETMLTPDPIVAGEQIVMTAALGAGPITRSMSHVLATGIAPTAAGIVYQPPSPARTRHVRLVLHNTTGAAIDCIVTTGFGSLVAHVTVAVDPTPPTIIDIEPLITGDSISLEASATGLNYIVYGTDMIDNRRVTSFTGLLMGAQSSVQSATYGLLAGDQWSDIQLAFTGN